MLFANERAAVILRELRSLTVTRQKKMEDFTVKEGFFLHPEEADKAPGRPFCMGEDYYVGNECHFWFTAEFTVPEEYQKEPVWLFLTGDQGKWSRTNPQILLFLNGKPVQGIDGNHQEVRIPEELLRGPIRLDLQLFTGIGDMAEDLRRRPQFLSVFLQNRSEAVEDLCYKLSVPLEILSRLPKDSTDAIRLSQAVQNAVNLLDLREPEGPGFLPSVEAARASLQKEIYEDMADSSTAIADCVGHTHIDVAWLWTFDQTKEKAARSFATVLKLMDEYPEYRFMSSQPQLYEYVKARYPEMYEEIRQRIKEGRWEPEGGMWVEADCNLPSGESLVRQFLYGKRFFQEEFGKDSRILWLPDVFGYSAALPQIMKKSGIDYFMTTKIAWNQFNKLPMDTFWWQGIDGTEIFTHLITAQNADQPEDSFFTTYNGDLNAVCAIRSWDRYQQKDLSSNILLAVGHGDGGGGTTREMLENGRRLSAGLPGAPKVQWTTSRAYFDELYKNCAQNSALPRWVGELYLEYHRGTYTSMARNKRANRKAELLWQEIESFYAWAELYGLPYPKEEIDAAWKLILLNQFHDVLPGSSIREVYEVTKKEYGALEEKGQKLLNTALNALASRTGAQNGDIAVFNSLPFSRNALVTADASITALRDRDGHILPGQDTEKGRLFLVPEVPAKGCRVLTPVKDEKAAPSPFTISDRGIETPFYRVEFDKNGFMTSVFDKEADRELVKKGGWANRLVAYEDKPMHYDNWDIDIYHTEKSWALDACEAEWVERGPIRAVFRIKRPFLHSTVNQDIIFYAHRREIEFDTLIDWKQHQVVLKAEFDLDIHTDHASYDIQFGNVTRPTHRNTSWETAKFEVCAHKWADMSEANYGAALLNDCKYGHSVLGNHMALTLLKSGIMPNPTADQETHRFRYALYPHLGDWRMADVPRAAYELNIPAHSLGLQRDASESDGAPLLSVQGDGVMLDTVKRSEDGKDLVLRFYEYKNSRSKTKVTFSKNVKDVTLCDLLEKPEKEISCSDSSFTFESRPYEINTFRVQLEP